MKHTELSFKGFVKEISDNAKGAYPRKFCFILGAGASKSSGIPTGQELVDVWERELVERAENENSHNLWKTSWNITDENKYNFYNHYYAEAFIELEEALLLSPNLDRAFAYRGLAKIQLALINKTNNFEDGISDLFTAIDKSPDKYNYYNRAEGYLLIDMLDEAQEDLEKCLEMDKEDPNTFFLFHVLYNKRGDTKKAAEYLELAKSHGYIETPEFAGAT